MGLRAGDREAVEAFLYSEDPGSAVTDSHALVDEARFRLLSGTLPEQEVEYDPVTDWGWLLRASRR